MAGNYYNDKLNSEKLFMVYDTKISRIKQYLKAEIDYICSSINGNETILELGAGYGRIIKEIAPYCNSVVGIDISENNVVLAKEYLKILPNADVIKMDVHNITVKSTFDIVLCLQNGISSMRITPEDIKNIMNLLNSGGHAFFSTYSSKFWDCRLEWFQEQASKGLLGEIDMENTGDGVIVCKDGFRATTRSPEEFEKIGRMTGYPFKIVEVDDSSLFLVIIKE
jgi:2-polyprenyl-6-hydroxyphenyl methylase/3-demethylubiquinone-9 3-methyltransferase